MEAKHIIALEIGSSKIRGAVATVDDRGTVNIIAIEDHCVIDCVRYGCIRNVEEVSNRISRILRDLERRISPRKIKSLYVGVGGLSFRSTPHEVVRRLPQESEFTEELRADLRAEALSAAVSDRRTVDVTENRFTIDHDSVTMPVGVYGQDIRALYSLISCNPKPMQMLQRTLSDRLRLQVNGYIVRQLAIADMVLSADEKQLGVVLVDFGAETTAISIYKQGALQYMATLPLGSRNITLDICSLNHLEERAEQIKKTAGCARVDSQPARVSAEGVNYDEINNFVAARSGEIIANINEQIKYAELSASQLPKGIVIVGGGARLNGFNERLEQETKMSVRSGAQRHSSTTGDSDMTDILSILQAVARRGACECAPEPETPATPAEEAPEPVRPAVTTEEPDDSGKKRRNGLWGRISNIARDFLSDDGYDDDFDDNK